MGIYILYICRQYVILVCIFKTFYSIILEIKGEILTFEDLGFLQGCQFQFPTWWVPIAWPQVPSSALKTSSFFIPQMLSNATEQPVWPLMCPLSLYLDACRFPFFYCNTMHFKSCLFYLLQHFWYNHLTMVNLLTISGRKRLESIPKHIVGSANSHFP
jgi:hypothetical protein